MDSYGISSLGLIEGTIGKGSVDFDNGLITGLSGSSSLDIYARTLQDQYGGPVMIGQTLAVLGFIIQLEHFIITSFQRQQQIMILQFKTVLVL